MARAALNWSLAQLAEAAGVHRNTISNFETGRYAGDPDKLAAIVHALEASGVEFIPENGEGPGVRLRKSSERQGGHTASTEIEALEAKIADIPTGGKPSPEGGMNTMRKAVAENDLAHLKGRRRKAERE